MCRPCNMESKSHMIVRDGICVLRTPNTLSSTKIILGSLKSICNSLPSLSILKVQQLRARDWRKSYV